MDCINFCIIWKAIKICMVDLAPGPSVGRLPHHLLELSLPCPLVDGKGRSGRGGLSDVPEQHTHIVHHAGQGCLSRPPAVVHGSPRDVCFPEEGGKTENAWQGWQGPPGRAVSTLPLGKPRQFLCALLHSASPSAPAIFQTCLETGERRPVDLKEPRVAEQTCPQHQVLGCWRGQHAEIVGKSTSCSLQVAWVVGGHGKQGLSKDLTLGRALGDE